MDQGICSAAIVCLIQFASCVLAAELPRLSAEQSGMNIERLAALDQLIAAAIEQQQMPGCVVLIGRPGGVVLLRAYGNKRIEPAIQAMSEDTVFDLASLTKPLATATSIMKLAEQQKLSVDDPVAKYIPEFAVEAKDDITIRDLMVHRSGLIPDNALSDYFDGPVKARERLFALKPSAPIGSSFRYSDVNFMILGEIVSRVAHEPLNEFARREIFVPLEMSETTYLPSETLRQRAAPTERRDGVWLQGEVHDPRAARLEGVAGHAGLFATATDLARFAMDALAGLEKDESRILKQTTWRAMIEPHTIPGTTQDGKSTRDIRGLGWDNQSRYSANRGTKLSPQAFGHGGFTGTVLWIDPSKKLFVVFLSNRLHPTGKGLVNPLVGKIVDLVVDSLQEVE